MVGIMELQNYCARVGGNWRLQEEDALTAEYEVDQKEHKIEVNEGIRRTIWNMVLLMTQSC